MPVRLAQFYAFVLLLICLAVNVAFFSDVREFFLGDEDPLASAQSAFAEWDIAAKIAAFYPSIPSKADEIADETPPEPARNPEPVSLESLLPKPPSSKPTIPEPVLPESLLPEPPPVPWEPEAEHAKEESPAEPQSGDPFDAPIETPPESAFDPFPQPAVAAARPVVADQFKPIVAEPKPPVPVRPSSAPVWGTIETVLERPIRYD